MGGNRRAEATIAALLQERESTGAASQVLTRDVPIASERVAALAGTSGTRAARIVVRLVRSFHPP
jgi:hypothetical protein